MGGYVRVPGGGYFAGPGGKAVRVGTFTPPVAERSVAPSSVTFDTSVPAGTEIAGLVFTGFPETSTTPFTAEFTNEFAGVAYTATLTGDAGGRVALTGNWTDGYKLVVGLTALAAGTYTLGIQVSGYAETFPISLTITAVSSGAEVLFTAKVENYDTVSSWADQEMDIGQWFAPGDVPPGRIAVLSVDGVRVPQQVSNRIYWIDGSLKLAQVRFLMPVISAGGTKTVTWQSVDGTWTATDAAHHTSTTAITSKVSLNYAFTSFKGRNATGTLTAERGPKNFKSSLMLGTDNSAWVERIMSGPVCTEWRATDLATNASDVRSPTEDLGCILYARAWGGTPNNPKRIQFLYRSIYGWNTDVAADQQGIRVDLNLQVNSTVVRGAAIGTAGWGAVNSWKGGFLASVAEDGRMDWYDVATSSLVTPPKLIYRHDVPYGVKARFVPPYDTTNSAFPMTAAASSYLPGRRGPLRERQADVAEHHMIAWTTAKPMAWCIAAHARATAAQLADHQKYARAAGWGMGAMTGIGRHRTTRKIICYLPPTKSSNLNVLGTGVWTGTVRKPANADENVRWRNGGTEPEISTLDSAHFPQMAFWPYISEGDQHWLDLVYQEATLPSLFDSDDYGHWGTSDRAKIPFGGIQWRGQIRSVTHTIRPIGNAMAVGHPSDPHWVMMRDLVDHWSEMTEELPLEEDAWRGGLDRTDGRRFQDLKLIWPNNEPNYKIWMHTFGVHSLSYAYGISEYPRLKSRADWFSHCPTVMAGGYLNDTGPEYYTMKPDPFNVSHYHSLCMSTGSGNTIEDRRFWLYGQWRNTSSTTTFKADNQTLVYTGAIPGTTGMMNGMIITISGIRSGSEPFMVTDMTKIPGLLTRNIPYYAVSSSGLTCKISLSPGGPPVTFNANGADIVGATVRCVVGGVHPTAPASTVGTGGDDYIIQVYAALSMYQHYVAPTDARVLLARQNLATLKAASTAPNAWDERGKVTVPLTLP
jgi:hypothetical protein